MNGRALRVADAEVALPRRADDVDLRHEHERRVIALLGHASRHYQGALATAPEALQYLRARGVNRESVRRFAMGFAPSRWRNLHRVLRDHDDSAVIDSGLVICKDGQSGDLRFDRFRNRIMFPIRDMHGNVVGFGGRTLSDEECLYAKYMNSPESVTFRKRGLLYGLFEARRAIEEAGSAILVEGYLDVVQLAQHGIVNTVATMGTAYTHEQLVSALAHTNNLMFCFDGDLAGKRAADAAMLAVLPFASDYRTIRFVFLPEGQDPDSLCRQGGAQAWTDAQARAVSLQQRIVASIHGDVDLRYAEGRAKLLHQGREIWRALPAGVVKEELFAYCCETTAMSRVEVLDLWKPARGTNRPLANQAATI